LKLLDQYTQFDALHWFQSVRRKYEADIKSQDVSDQKTRRNTSVAEEEKLQQTKALALKRIKIYQRVSDQNASLIWTIISASVIPLQHRTVLFGVFVRLDHHDG